MRQLAQYVFDHHLKKNPDSPQRGMVYEYFDVRREGQFDQFVQGEGLDTMHDGAWLAAALAHAYRATGESFYKTFLTKWLLPFYLKMLNHSDQLFSAKRNDARTTAKPWGKEWAFQEGEKGFVPPPPIPRLCRRLAAGTMREMPRRTGEGGRDVSQTAHCFGRHPGEGFAVARSHPGGPPRVEAGDPTRQPV
jgi:hypothetical protein